MSQVFLFLSPWKGLEAGRLKNCLLKRRRAAESSICGNLMHDRTGARGLSENSHAVRVSTEQVDVLLDPLESQTLVQ